MKNERMFFLGVRKKRISLSLSNTWREKGRNNEFELGLEGCVYIKD